MEEWSLQPARKQIFQRARKTLQPARKRLLPARRRLQPARIEIQLARKKLQPNKNDSSKPARHSSQAEKDSNQRGRSPASQKTENFNIAGGNECCARKYTQICILLQKGCMKVWFIARRRPAHIST